MVYLYNQKLLIVYKKPITYKTMDKPKKMAKSKKITKWKKSRHKIILHLFNLYEISRKCKTIRTESRSVFAWYKEKEW